MRNLRMYICVNIELDATNHKYGHYMSCIMKLPHVKQMQPLELIVIISVIIFMANNCICTGTNRLTSYYSEKSRKKRIVWRLEMDYLLTTSNLCVKSTLFPLLCLKTISETTRTRETAGAIRSISPQTHLGSFYDRRFDVIDNARREVIKVINVR